MIADCGLRISDCGLAMEDNTPKPKRRAWFQFHLSTAIVLMFVAAGLLWLNMRARLELESHDEVTAAGRPSISFKAYARVGWPYERRVLITEGGFGISERLTAAELRRCFDSEVPDELHNELRHATISHLWHSGTVLVNLAINGAILAAVAFACEWRIRRRARSRPPGP